MATAKKKTTKKKTIRKHAGINQTTGKLKKGWKYSNGTPVKASAKKGLGKAAPMLCTRRNSDGSSTSYSAGNDGSCRYGGTVANRGGLNGAKRKTTKKKIRKHVGINQTTGRLKKGYKYSNGRVVKAATKK